MGHYDSCYEADRDEELERERKYREAKAKRLKVKINEYVDAIDDFDDVEFVFDILANLDDHKTFFRVLRGYQ